MQIAGSISCYVDCCKPWSSGCVGGFARPPPITAPEKSRPKKSRGSKRYVQGHTARPPRDWWTSSSDDMDSNGMLNARSFQNFPISTHSLHISTSSNSTFSNHGLMLWNEQREEWVGNKPRQQSQGSRESVISGSTTYEDLLGTSRPFPQPVHLPEMVEFLVDVWEQEGLYEIR
ncbi:unnamed protein product [Sphagnum jensenii]|uniref:Gag1-like clamp domain-containing protein n=2 Tax=Sphagnum jensenii TaxID=128206 RepID=A0ABP0ZZ81_9BRYO